MKVSGENQVKTDCREEIEHFKSTAKRITPTPAEWLKLRKACISKFGEDKGPKRFKEWQHGKLIQFRPYD